MSDNNSFPSFTDWRDEWLDDVTCAIDAAAGEGAFYNPEMVEAIRHEYKRRQRKVPSPYSQNLIDPDEWRVES